METRQTYGVKSYPPTHRVSERRSAYVSICEFKVRFQNDTIVECGISLSVDDGIELTVRHVETEVREGKVNLNYVKNKVEGLTPVVRKKRTSKIGNSSYELYFFYYIISHTILYLYMYGKLIQKIIF